MPELILDLDRRDLSRLRRLAGASRLMAAKALTFTAEKAVPAWKAGQAIFHKRNSWLDRGVRKRAATPGNLNAQVGTLDRFMGRHVVGVDEPKGGRLFVPIYRSIGEAKKHNVARRRMERMGKAKRKPFILRSGGDVFVVRRKRKARAPLEVLGKLQTGANVEARFDPMRIVDGVVRREFPRVYERLILKWADTGAV